MIYDTIILGAGAGGLMCAAHLSKAKTLLIEGNAAVGAKIGISGGGKCNITNAVVDASYYRGEGAFITTVLRRFDERALLRWLRERGLEPVLRKKSQYFCPRSATEMVRTLQNAAARHRVVTNTRILSVRKRGDRFEVETSRGVFEARRVVVATGGKSFPKLGATGIGYDIAESFGHTVVPTAPALVGLTVQKEQFFFKSLSGVSTPVRIETERKTTEGMMLFTHKGVSGPAVLNASLYWEKGALTIDFLPGSDLGSFQNARKRISSLLPMPKRLTKAFLLQLALEDKEMRRLTREERRKLEGLHRYRMAPAGTLGYAKAEVTRGGVATEEIDPESMMSRKVKGLYFVGEVVDVTGEVGGYNFQWAFSSAFVAARHINEECR